MSGREKVRKYHLAIVLGVVFFRLFPQVILRFIFKRIRNLQGYFGLFFRYILLKNLAKSCGENVSIQPGVFLLNINNISIGNNVSIHPMSYIDGLGGLTIMNNVSMAHSSTVLTSNHTWSNPEIPIKYNSVINASVVIEDDVWIGCGSRILAGVHIHSRSIVAAGAIVNKNVQSHTIVGGVPAKVIKHI